MKNLKTYSFTEGSSRSEANIFLKHYNKTARLAELRKSMNLLPAHPKVTMPVRLRLLERYGTDITRCPKWLIETVSRIQNHLRQKGHQGGDRPTLIQVGETP